MKKRAIAVLLSVFLATGSIGAVPVFAVETIAEEAVDVEEVAENEEQEEASEETEIIEDAEISLTVEEAFEEEPVVEDEKTVPKSEEAMDVEVIENEITDEQDEPTDLGNASVDIAETETSTVIEEEIVTADEKEATLASNGTCGENATWTLTGTDDDLTLTISGSGDMDNFKENHAPWESKKTMIKTLYVEDGIKTIGNYAFLRCSSLENVTLPNSVTNIGIQAFRGCTSLNSIIIPDSVTGIDSNAFSGCTNLTNIIIPNSVTTIGVSAFNHCDSLESIIIPDSVTSIGRMAFCFCGSLKSITIPDSVTRISDYMCNTCTSLKSITIPDSVTVIGVSAFFGCSSLESITIPDSVTDIGTTAFANCQNLMNIYFEGDAPEFQTSTVFNNVTANAYYYPDNPTWTKDVRKDYGGKITWVPYEIDTGLWMTIFSNVNEDVIFDGGHAFLNVENCTDQDVYIGPYILKAQDDVYISGRGVLPDVWNKSQLKMSSGGVFLNTESLYDRAAMEKKGENYYRNFAWYTVSIKEEDLDTLYSCIKAYGNYGPTNNCTHFASKTWNRIVDESYKVCETGSPFVLKNYLVDTLGAETATELLIDDKDETAQLIFDSNGDLMPFVLNTVPYSKAIDTLSVQSVNANSVTLKWESPRYEIGRDKYLRNTQFNITKLVLEYTRDGASTPVKIGLPPDSTEKTITGLEYGTKYNFHIYGISDHRSTKAGIVTGRKNLRKKCEATTPPGASSKVTCTNVASGIKVSWEKVKGATSYYVYRDNKQIFKTSALEVTDKEVKYNSGTKYVYKVVATTKNVGDSPKARTATMYRLMPVGIKSLTNPSAGKMTVTYDKANGSSGYVVRFGLKSDMSDAKVITVSGANTTSKTFGSMKKGKTYYVQVRTYKIENGVRYYSGYCTTKTITIKK